MALLFVTARRRNGFAAVQDLLTGTRVVSRAALSARPVLPASEVPPPAVESAITIGPYHVLQALDGVRAREKWFLAYDLKLLRKVWLRVVPPGTRAGSGPVAQPGPGWPTALADRETVAGGELGRLRGPDMAGLSWNWSRARNRGARCVTGCMIWPRKSAPRRKMARCPNSPLTASGSPAKAGPNCSTSPHPARSGNPNPETRRPNRMQLPPTQTAQALPGCVAAAALAGTGAASGKAAGEVAVPLPLHARAFLKGSVADGGRGGGGGGAQAAVEPGGGGFAPAAGRAGCRVRSLSVAGVRVRDVWR